MKVFYYLDVIFIFIKTLFYNRRYFEQLPLFAASTEQGISGNITPKSHTIYTKLFLLLVLVALSKFTQY